MAWRGGMEEGEAFSPGSAGFSCVCVPACLCLLLLPHLCCCLLSMLLKSMLYVSCGHGSDSTCMLLLLSQVGAGRKTLCLFRLSPLLPSPEKWQAGKGTGCCAIKKALSSSTPRQEQAEPISGKNKREKKGQWGRVGLGSGQGQWQLAAGQAGTGSSQPPLLSLSSPHQHLSSLHSLSLTGVAAAGMAAS